MQAHRADIDAYFAALCAKNPHLWNGRVILMRDHALEDGVLTGSCIETDFAAFTWWRERGLDDLAVANIFSLAALEGSDGTFVMGVMGDHTASPGSIYFPGGTPDLQDVQNGRLDLHGSALREMEEEVGLSGADVSVDAGWDAVVDGIYFGLMRRLVFRETGDALATRIRGFLAAEARPELKDVRMIGSEADISPEVTSFAAAYVRWRWAQFDPQRLVNRI